MSTTGIGLIGAGAIGRAHLGGATGAGNVSVVGIADPNPAAEALAREFGIPWFKDYRMMIDRTHPEGVVIATPNSTHVPIGLDCLGSRIGLLIEKPIADSVAEGRRLSEAARVAGVALLVGHHRRHHPIIKRVQSLIQQGVLGRFVSVGVLAMFQKADSYFDVPWRREEGGGPILINMIHEIDLLRFLCGEISSLQATASNAIRGFPVEDSAAAMLKFANGGIGTITLSDTAAAPWSWDLTSGENRAFPRSEADTHFICGTDASISFPRVRLWRYTGARGWHEPLAIETVEVSLGDPYAEQLRHFAAVIRGEEAPVVDGFDATRTLETALAVRAAAESGEAIAFC